MDRDIPEGELQFTETIPVAKIRGIYLLWKDGIIVYVGQSENIMQRIGVHLADPNKDFDGWSYAIINTGNLNEIEAELIIKHQPKLNKSLPANSQYATPAFMRKHFGFNGWQLRRTLRKIQPIWKDYYKVSDLEGVA